MRLYNIFLAADILVMMMLLPACDSSADTASLDSNLETQSSISNIKIPKAIKEKLGENLSVDATIEAPPYLPKEIGIVPAKIMDLKNKEKAMSLFFPGQSMSKVHEESFQYRDGSKGIREYYQSKNGDFFNWEGKNLSCSRNMFSDIEEAFTPDEINRKIYSEKELPFMTSAKAEKKAETLLTVLGVATVKPVQTYALDYRILEQEQKKHQSETADELPPSKRRPPRKWTREDDCYMFRFQQEINGIPISGEYLFGDLQAQTQTRGPIILIYYGKRGYINATVDNLYQTSGNTRKGRAPLGLDQALSSLKDIFGEVIMDTPIKVNKIEFAYVPVLAAANQENYLLTPTWIFHLSQYSPEIKKDVKTRVIIDALTGKEMEKKVEQNG